MAESANVQQETDLQERVNKFNEEVKPLFEKYELALAAAAKITPDGRIMANPVVISTRVQEEQKPEVVEEKKEALTEAVV